MLTWENSTFAVDASVRVALLDRDVPSYFKSLEHLVRYCARPAFALEPARGRPASWAEILQVHDDRDAIQASHDDIPVIDISSL